MIRPSLVFGLLALLSCRTGGPGRPTAAVQTVAPTTPTSPGGGPAPAAAKVEALATVGDVTIGRTEFDAIVALKLAKYTDRDREVPTRTRARYERTIAERLARHEQLAQESRRVGVEIDAAALAAREASQRAGIRNWAEDLRRRGESEQSMRAMLVAELQEDALARRYEPPVEELGVVDRYEEEKPEHTAEQGWIRTATVTMRPIRATNTTPRITAVCDDYLTKYKRCIEEHVPEAARPQMIESMHATADAWLADAQRGKATELDVACRAATDSATTSMARLGCDWKSAAPTSDALPPNKAELAETKRRAQSLTTAARKPGELAELAKAEKLEVSIDERLVAREVLDPAVRKSLAGLKLGQTSKPIAFNRGYRVIQVLELEPPGPLPLEHRRAEIIAALREEDREAPREELRDQLDQRYPIRYLIDLADAR